MFRTLGRLPRFTLPGDSDSFDDANRGDSTHATLRWNVSPVSGETRSHQSSPTNSRPFTLAKLRKAAATTASVFTVSVAPGHSMIPKRNFCAVARPTSLVSMDDAKLAASAALVGVPTTWMPSYCKLDACNAVMARPI